MELLSYKENTYDNLAKEIFNEISFPFPPIATISDEANFIFSRFSPKIGSVSVVYGESGIGKSFFFDLICGCQKPSFISEKESELLFLKYEIAYKKEEICPKFVGNVEELIKVKLNNNINETIYKDIAITINLEEFINKNIKDLTIEEIEKIAFMFTLLEDKSIYVLDIRVRKIQLSTRNSLIEYLSKYAKTYNKIVIVVEDNMKLIANHINSIYFIKKEDKKELYDKYDFDENLDLITGTHYNLQDFLLTIKNA